MPSLQRLPVTTALGARYLISSSSPLLHLSYNLSCSILFDRFSALFLSADKSSGRCSSLTHLPYNLPCSIPLTHQISSLIPACGQVQWTLALKVFFLPELCCELCKSLLPAAFAAGGVYNSIDTKTIHERNIDNILLYSLRYIAPIPTLWTSPEDSIHNLVLEIPLSVRPPLRSNCSWLTLI